MALGQTIVRQLKLDPGVDTLSRWMAHYVADLIVQAKKATGREKAEMASRCAETILTLWKHRGDWPSGTRPFESHAAIRQVLLSLSLEPGKFRYFDSLLRRNVKKRRSKEEQWLSLVADLDYCARSLIRYFLAQASDGTSKKTKKWIELASAIGRDDEIDFDIARFLSAERDLVANNTDAKKIRELQTRIERLDVFVKSAEVVANDMRRQLGLSPI